MPRVEGRLPLAVVGLLLLAMPGCHGRPLRAQIAAAAHAQLPARDTATPRPVYRPLSNRSRGENPDRPGIFTLTREDLEPARAALALRNPRTHAVPCGPRVVERAAALGRSFHGAGNPAKAYKPGGVCVDVPRLVRFFAQLLQR